MYRGAFVSTKPELDFGDYILAFNRNIERRSGLIHGFLASADTYWAGFKENIPVNKKTVQAIWVNGPVTESVKALAAEHHLTVVPLPSQKKTEQVPKEWLEIRLKNS